MKEFVIYVEGIGFADTYIVKAKEREKSIADFW